MTLRTRLLLATALAALSAVLVVDVATFVLLTGSQLQQVDDSLEQTHVPIEQLVQDGSAQALSTIPVIAPGTFVAVIQGGQEVVFDVPVRRGGSHAVAVDQATLLALSPPSRGEGAATVEGENGDRVRLRIDPLDDERVLVTGLSLHQPDEVRGALLRILSAATAAALLAATVLGAWLIRGGLKPLRSVESSARQITDDDLSEHRVPGADETTEVGQLATSLNAMLDRLQAARDEREASLIELQASENRMRRFVADASHELRTPIAATAAYAELFERGARDRPEDLRRAMAGIRTETDRMSGLVDDLMALARLDEQRGLFFDQVDLTEILFVAVDAARAVAPDRLIRTDVPEVIEMWADGAAMRQVLDNLLANVRTHTPSGTTSHVELRRDGDTVMLQVSDEGGGVTEEQLEHLFDRFYRADPSRTRESGGAGLGLSIVRAIVIGHGGSIEAIPNAPSGLTVKIRMPSDREPGVDGPTHQQMDVTK